jgi:hypothetical protein
LTRRNHERVADNGWLERYRATDEWLQLRLNWAAYVAANDYAKRSAEIVE